MYFNRRISRCMNSLMRRRKEYTNLSEDTPLMNKSEWEIFHLFQESRNTLVKSKKLKNFVGFNFVIFSENIH